MLAINSLDETKVYEMVSPDLKKQLMLQSFRVLLREIHINCGRIKEFGVYKQKKSIYEYFPSFSIAPCRIDLSFNKKGQISYFIIQKIGPS